MGVAICYLYPLVGVLNEEKFLGFCLCFGVGLWTVERVCPKGRAFVTGPARAWRMASLYAGYMPIGNPLAGVIGPVQGMQSSMFA